jgi:hypothetical protein
MNSFKIYFEDADTDDPKVYIGTIYADTMGDALEKASEQWGFETHDLVAIQVVSA